MLAQMPDLLALINDMLQAVIVIFGTAVFLYNLRYMLRDRVMRAFNALLFFVVIVFLTELMANRTTLPVSTESWLRLEWVGIAFVPAAQLHLSDALLRTTGYLSRMRTLFVRAIYLLGLVCLALAVFSNLIVGSLINMPRAPHLAAGPLFPFFALYFWLITLTSIYNVWLARQRCVTRTSRQRMTMILLAFLAAPLAVFPYLLLSGNTDFGDSILFWLVLIAGNLVVSVMFALLTYHMAYFGAFSPDRVVRVRLFKFMARVPLAATIVLIVYILVGRTSQMLGLPVETAWAFSIVATVMLVQWAIQLFKQPLERLLQLNNDPDVRRIQELGERLLTTRDLHQFLEGVLLAICDAVRSPAAFVAAFTPEGPQVEVMVGMQPDLDTLRDAERLQAFAQPANNGATVTEVNQFLVWENYWIRPLYNRKGDALLGILGVQARAETPDLTEAERPIFERLLMQAARALEDRLLQQGVFAAVEGLLPQVRALQRQRSAASYTSAAFMERMAEDDGTLVDDPDFYNMVWDAMSHYWGGPKLTESPLLELQIVQQAMEEHGGSQTKALRDILSRAIAQQKPEGLRSLTTTEWLLYNILELKFVQGRKVRDVARRLAMSESDLYRKQRIAIENVARAVSSMEKAAQGEE
jgi:hypothetical protein